MQHGQWVKLLRDLREKPEFAIGSKQTGHLLPMTELFRLMWETQAFTAPRAAAMTCSPRQCRIQCETGPVHPEIEELMECESCDVLFDELPKVGNRLREKALMRTADWLEPFISTTFGFGYFGMPLFLADRGLLGIRTRAGLWCQGYERGWPTTAPVLLNTDSPVGVVFAAALNPAWFTGLPFTLEQVAAAVPNLAKPYVCIGYRPTDDLIPERFLQPKDVSGWL